MLNDFFDIAIRVLLEVKLVPYLFVISLDYVI